MGRGLDLILSKIRAQPSPILASRYLSLVTELEDEEEKLARTLDLAEVLVTLRPKEALRLALLAHRAHRSDIRPLDIMIRVMEAADKPDRVLVLKGEKSRLEAAQDAVSTQWEVSGEPRPEVQRQTHKQDLRPNEPKPLSMNFVEGPSGSESRILEAFLDESSDFEGVLPWDRPSDKPLQSPPAKVPSPPPSPVVKSSSSIPTPTFTLPPASLAAPPSPSVSSAPSAPVVAPLVSSQKLKPTPQEDPLPQKASRPERTQLSSRIVKGLQGKKPNDTVLGIRAHSEPPHAPARELASLKPEAEVGFVMDLGEKPSVEGDRGFTSEAPFLSQARTSVSLPVIGRPQPSPIVQRESKGETKGESKGDSKGDSKAEDRPPIGAGEPKSQGSLPQEHGDTEISKALGKTLVPMTRNPEELSTHPSQPSHSFQQSHQDLLVELGRIASRGVIKPAYGAKESGGSSTLGNYPGGLQELLSRIAPGQPWSVVAWDLFQALWGENPDENTRSLLDSGQLSRHTPGFWGFYLDALCRTSGFRRALWEIRMTLNQNPTLPWVEVAARRLPQIWSGLGVKGFVWKPEEGVNVLLSKLSRSPVPLMPALVGGLVEEVDHHKETRNR